MGAASFTRARDRLLHADSRGVSSEELCKVAVTAFHDVLRFSWCAIMTTDPATLLPSGGTVEGFTPEACTPFWDNGLLDPDFNKFTDLARAVDPVATLVEATDGDLSRSPRFNKLFAELGVADELRMVFKAGDSDLAVGTFVRAEADGPVTPEELADVRALVPVVSRVLQHALGRMLARFRHGAPTVILVDADGGITSISEGGHHVLEDLRINQDTEPLPGIVRAAAMKARWSRASTAVTTRVLGHSGYWMRLHAVPLQGSATTVAVTIEPARADDVAQVLLDSYGLTQREIEIVFCLCRGLPTKTIAAELLISVHTVRDYIKTIFEKAGVNSRGELVAGLFTNHVLRQFHDSISHVDAPAG